MMGEGQRGLAVPDLVTLFSQGKYAIPYIFIKRGKELLRSFATFFVILGLFYS